MKTNKVRYAIVIEKAENTTRLTFLTSQAV